MAKPRVIGWREWVSLPALGIDAIEAKVDTGARSSAIHAIDIVRFTLDGVETVRFKVHPHQRTEDPTVVCEAEVLGERLIRSSSGHRRWRVVIRTDLEYRQERWSIELTLAERRPMDFRMLLGRQALSSRFLVDPARSFLGGRGHKLS